MFRFVRKLKPYLSPHKAKLISFVIIISISLILDIIKIFWSVDLMDFDSNTPMIKIATLIGGIAIFTVLISILNFIAKMLVDFVTINVFEKVRQDIYKHISNLKVDFAKSGVEGDFLTRWAVDLKTTQNIFMSSITSLIISPVATVIYAVYLSIKRWDLFLLSFLPVLLGLCATNTYGRYLGRQVKEEKKEQAKLNDMMKDSVVCMQIVKIYMLIKRLCDKFYKVNIAMYKIQRDNTIACALSYCMADLIWFDMGSVVCYAYGGYLCYIGQMDLVSLFVFKFIFSAFTNCVINLPAILQKFSFNTLYINRVFDIFDYPVEDMEKNTSDEVCYENCIEFRNVSFSYNQQDILKDCSFEIKKGERVAIAGENCKTTILNLMCGFYDASCGGVSVCGYNINKANLNYIRDKISIVEQQPTVFLGTIKDNVICGYKYDKERFYDVTKMALVSDFVKTFSNEYNTRIKGQSSILSGGQCQRLNLARALYKSSEILLLDNYTSALDNDTKRRIYQNMSTIKDRTVVVFSNNLYDLQQVDRVILLKDGQVYKQGRHQDILMECSYYRDMINKQSEVK